ncbi:MAG TPA: glycosyltransferase, partial [Pyrinomonadaceae bacterium]|nr:glycosyltransferase [Pyrinomonadaceae bacterium]
MLNWESSEAGWRSLYQSAEARQRSGIDWPQVLDYCQRAHQNKRDRAEALHQVGVHFRTQKLYHLAYVFLKQAMSLPRPSQTAGRFNEHALPMEYARCCVEVGEHARAIEAGNSLLYGGKLPADLADKVYKTRELGLEKFYPKVPEPPALTNPIKLCIILNNPGPFLETCIDSLLNQEYEDFKIIFIDDASIDGSHARISQDDSRVTLIRNRTRRGFNECLRQCVTQYCGPDDIIFPLEGATCLAYC